MGNKALVADDDPDLLAAVAASMHELGLKVQRATNGAEFIQYLAEAGPYDIVVTDIAMPWMSGLQAALAHRADDRAAGREGPWAGGRPRYRRRAPAQTFRARRARRGRQIRARTNALRPHRVVPSRSVCASVIDPRGSAPLDPRGSAAPSVS
jgi:CheY-like chemotaxis protein